MEPFFRHLRPPEPSADTTAQKRYARTVDLDRTTGLQSGGSQLVKGTDGEVYQIPISLPSNQPELASFDRITPSTMIPAMGMSDPMLDLKTKQLMREIEDREEGMPLLNIEAEGGEQIQARGLLAGLDLAPFQVAWIGGNDWRVEAGEIRWPRVTSYDSETGERPFTQAKIEVRRRDVSIAKGWIVIEVTVTPDSDDRYGYDLRASQIEAIPSWTNNPPSRVIEPVSEEESKIIWSPGVMYVPLAYVSVETGNPVILPARSGNNINIVGTGQYGPGLPNI